MAELDPRAIVPENHKTIRKLDGSLGVAKLQQVETKASKEFTPILKAVVELVKCYQSDTNAEEDLRVKNLADLILDRHTAMLNTMTKDADTWAKVKWYIEAKVGELVLQYSIDNSNSAKDDVKVVTKKINDAITKALIEWNKKNKPKLTSTEEKRIEVIELDKEVVNKKTDKLMQSKEYKSFLSELKSDFEGFVKDYDANRKILITNYKKAIDNNIIKTKKPKQNILTKLTDIFKDKPITKKDRQPKKSLNPFRSFDIKGLAKTVSVGVIGFVEVSAGLIGKFFKGKVYSLAAKLMKSVVYGAIGTMAGMLKGFLNMFGRGPFGMILSLVLFPIKLIASGLMLVIKPLVKLIKGLANIILAPIKILVLGPIKLLKKFGSFVTGIFKGMFSFLNKRTILSLFKIFLTTGGAFMLGYIIGMIYVRILPFLLKLSKWIKTGTKYVNKIYNFIYGDKNDSYFKKLFDKENKFLPGTFSYKLHDIILTAYQIFEDISAKCGITLTNVAAFFKGVFNWFMTSSPTLNMIMNIIISKPFKILLMIVDALHKGLKGPIATVFSKCTGITKMVGIGLSIGVEAVRKFFLFWSRNSEEHLELKNAFKEGVKAKTTKQLASIGIVGENAEQYEDLHNGVNNEVIDIPALSKELNELRDISEKTNGNLSEYPLFILKVITSYALGSKNPETFYLAPDFGKYSLEILYQALCNILKLRKERAGKLAGILISGNKNQILNLLDTIKNNPKELSINNVKVKDKNGKNKTVNFRKTLEKIEADGDNTNSGLNIGGNLTLKAVDGRTLKINSSKLTKELLEAMKEAGIVTDSEWFGDGITIDISPDKLAAYTQKYAEKRQLNLLNSFTSIDYTKFNNGNAVSSGLKIKIKQALEDYFKSNDVSSLSDKDIQRDLEMITKGILKGQKVALTHGKIDVKKEFSLVDKKAKIADEVLSKVDNGLSTVVVAANSDSLNPAAEEVKHQQ